MTKFGAQRGARQIKPYTGSTIITIICGLWDRLRGNVAVPLKEEDSKEERTKTEPGIGSACEHNIAELIAIETASDAAFLSGGQKLWHKNGLSWRVYFARVVISGFESLVL